MDIRTYLEGLSALNEADIWRGKQVVAQVGDYRIAVDDPDDATYVSAWADDGKMVGSLSTRRTPDRVGKDYLSISRVEIQPKHRGHGLGHALYRALLDHLGPRWKGIGSYLPDQANRRQVPRIWKRLDGRPHEASSDHIVADRPIR